MLTFLDSLNVGVPVNEYDDVEAALIDLMVKSGRAPLKLDVRPTFSQLVSEIGEAVLSETAERAEALVEVLGADINKQLKEKLVDLLSVDIIDVIAMTVEKFGGNAEDVYLEFAEIEDKEERARKAVSTFASLLLEAVRAERS
jgi:hypothetical protein